MAILRGLGSKVLPCGCFVGVYETYQASVVGRIDARHPSCDDPRHVRHAPVLVPAAAEQPPVREDLPGSH